MCADLHIDMLPLNIAFLIDFTLYIISIIILHWPDNCQMSLLCPLRIFWKRDTFVHIAQYTAANSGESSWLGYVLECHFVIGFAKLHYSEYFKLNSIFKKLEVVILRQRTTDKFHLRGKMLCYNKKSCLTFYSAKSYCLARLKKGQSAHNHGERMVASLLPEESWSTQNTRGTQPQIFGLYKIDYEVAWVSSWELFWPLVLLVLSNSRTSFGVAFGKSIRPTRAHRLADAETWYYALTFFILSLLITVQRMKFLF